MTIETTISLGDCANLGSSTFRREGIYKLILERSSETCLTNG